MPKAYYSLVIDFPATQVWAVIRRFDAYAWAGVEGETLIENDKGSEQVGAIRRFAGAGTMVRQRLLAHSDLDRSYSYAFCDAAPMAMQDYVATLRVRPVTEDDRCFVEWEAEFDCALEQRTQTRETLEQQGFAKWLAGLRAFMAKAG